MIRYLLLASLSLFVGVILLASTGSAPPRADLTYVNPNGIHTLDPARMSWTQDIRVALNIWEGLTAWNPQTLEPVEGAAHFPPEISDDGCRYIFTIRPDARWSNGDPVAAEDFVRGWRRALEPGTATDYTFLLADHIAGADQYVRWRREAVATLAPLKRLRDGWQVTPEQAAALEPAGGDADRSKRHEHAFHTHAAALDERFARVGIKAANENTLVVELRQPCPYFLDLTAFPIFLPCHKSIELLRERHDDAPITAEGLVVYDPQWTKPDYHHRAYPGLVTNGPYVLSEWVFKRRIRLTPNPHHRLTRKLSCRTVDMLTYENISASIMAYEAGDVDFLTAMDVPYAHEIARLARSGDRPDFHLCHVLGTYFFNFNCTSEQVHGVPNPFRDRRVRKAFALAVDKTQIVESVLKRGDRVARSFVPADSIPGYEPPAGLPHDVGRAAELLAAAGYPGGAGLPTVQLLYTPNDELICQAVARMWQGALGARVELESKEPKTFAEDKANHDFMVARGNWFADYNDPTTFLDCLGTGNGNNDSGYANPRYDALLIEAGGERDRNRRAELLRRAEAIIVQDDLPILPILHYAMPIAIKPHIKGLHPNARLWFPFYAVTIQ
jgi:oligopeptide transport system substrate-binding protein